jgi:hypothetical protein
MDAFEHRLRDSECRIATFGLMSRASEDQDARLIAEQPADGILAEVPHVGDLSDGVMSFGGHTRARRHRLPLQGLSVRSRIPHESLYVAGQNLPLLKLNAVCFKTDRESRN